MVWSYNKINYIGIFMKLTWHRFSISLDIIYTDEMFLMNIVNRKCQHSSEYSASLLNSFIQYEDDNLLILMRHVTSCD